MTPRDELVSRIYGLQNIPANEQCLGIFQRAVAEILIQLEERVNRTEDHLHDKFGERP